MASDEELKAMGIKQANNQNRNNNSNGNNQIATVLKAFSIITMIMSVIVFLIFMEENFYTGLIVGVSGIVGGILFWDLQKLYRNCKTLKIIQESKI